MPLFVRHFDSEDLGPHLPLVDIMRADARITDSTGIPLLSNRGPLGKGIDFQDRPCPYINSPSRYPYGNPHELPMSGLEHRRLSEDCNRIRRLMLAARQSLMPPETEMSVASALGILGLMQYLPRYLVTRAKDPVDPEGLPSHLIVGSNSASGSIAAIGAFARGQTNQTLPGGKVLLQAAEDEGSLVGKDKVCVASPHMITLFLDTLRQGDASLSHGTVEEETGGLLTDSEVQAAAMFGELQESAGPFIGELHAVDSFVLESLRKFNPRKQKPGSRKVKRPIEELRGQIRATTSALLPISAGSNLMLGRQPGTGNVFADVVTNNPFRLKSLYLAMEKGIPVKEVDTAHRVATVVRL